MKRLLFPLLILVAVFTSCDDTTDGLGATLIDISDNIDVTSATFNVKSESVIMDSVLSRSSIGYLGKIKDPQTGAYITSNFSTQFHTLSNYRFPDKDSIVTRIEGVPVADSVEVIIYYSSHYGDSLTTMKCTLHEFDHPLEESNKYYSNFSPFEKGYIREGGIHKQKTYAITDYSVSDYDRNSTVPNFRITLNEPYTAKDGRTYNNYGTYIMQMSYEHPEYFKNSQTFMYNVCPGFYLESTSGLGSMAYIDLTQLNVYFEYMTNDSTYHGVASFAGTEEVLQKTNISQEREELQRLAEDATCTYIKTPSGIFTQLTLPVDEIINGHENDTINSARVSILRENNENASDYMLPAPSTLLMLPTDSISNFFENNKIADNRTSYIASLATSSNSYVYGNIATMIRAMKDAKIKYMNSHPEITDQVYEQKFPNWNKVTLVPVKANYTTISTSSVLSRLTHDMSLSCTKLFGGKANPDAIKISVVYTKQK